MADFLFDSVTQDLDFSKGLQITTNEVELARHALEQGLDLWWGEWFLDVTEGLPYMHREEESLPLNVRYFLGEEFPSLPEYITSYLDDYISSQQFIKSLKSSSHFDPATRVYTYSFRVALESGEEIVFNNFITETL